VRGFGAIAGNENAAQVGLHVIVGGDGTGAPGRHARF